MYLERRRVNYANPRRNQRGSSPFLDSSRKRKVAAPIQLPGPNTIFKYSMRTMRKIWIRGGQEKEVCGQIIIFLYTRRALLLVWRCNVCDVIAKQILGVWFETLRKSWEIVTCSLVAAGGCGSEKLDLCQCGDANLRAAYGNSFCAIWYNDKNLNISVSNFLMNNASSRC